MSRPREGEATAHDAVVGGEFSHQAETFHRFVASSLREHATFGVGDATDTSLPPASFDGAVSRFALHHIPVPGRQAD